MKPKYHAAFYEKVERDVPPNSIVFVRYARRHNAELDLINNEPDLRRADRIYAYDFGRERNEELLGHFPGRQPWLYLENGARFVPGTGTGAEREEGNPD